MLSFFDAIAIGSLIEKRRVHLSLLRATPVLIPPLPEQQKIAEILSIWEKAIDQTQKLIEAKKRRKKALMQQLLSGELTPLGLNHETWPARKLGELVVPVSRPVPKPENPYLSIGLRSHGKGTFQRTVEEPDKVMMDTLYRVEEGDLVVNITFAWEGAIAFVPEKDSGGLVSHRFPTYRLKETEVDRGFFRNLIQTKRFVWDLGLISPGGAGRNRVLSQKDFLKQKVHVPSLGVQERVGEMLEAAYDELRLCEEYLVALEKQKRGLMQKLLTGEVRVRA
jgi:type I restriction enzyme S subunit